MCLLQVKTGPCCPATADRCSVYVGPQPEERCQLRPGRWFGRKRAELQPCSDGKNIMSINKQESARCANTALLFFPCKSRRWFLHVLWHTRTLLPVRSHPNLNMNFSIAALFPGLYRALRTPQSGSQVSPGMKHLWIQDDWLSTKFLRAWRTFHWWWAPLPWRKYSHYHYQLSTVMFLPVDQRLQERF